MVAREVAGDANEPAFDWYAAKVESVGARIRNLEDLGGDVFRLFGRTEPVPHEREDVAVVDLEEFFPRCRVALYGAPSKRFGVAGLCVAGATRLTPVVAHGGFT